MGNTRRNRGDLSGPIYTILMMVFVIIASVLLYNYFQGRASVLTTQTQLSVINAQLAGNVYAITIQNMGTTNITLSSLSIYQQGSSAPMTTQSLSVSLKPGQSTTVVGTVQSGFSSGVKYVVVVQGRSQDGQSVAAEGIAIAQ